MVVQLFQALLMPWCRVHVWNFFCMLSIKAHMGCVCSWIKKYESLSHTICFRKFGDVSGQPAHTSYAAQNLHKTSIITIFFNSLLQPLLIFLRPWFHCHACLKSSTLIVCLNHGSHFLVLNYQVFKSNQQHCTLEIICSSLMRKMSISTSLIHILGEHYHLWRIHIVISKCACWKISSMSSVAVKLITL